MTRTRTLTLALALAILLAGCSTAPAPDSPTPAERTVVVEPPSPTPVERTVTIQRTVTIERIVTRTVTVPSPTPRVETVVHTAPEPTAVPVQGDVQTRVHVSTRVQDGWLFHYITPTVVNHANVDLVGVTVRFALLNSSTGDAVKMSTFDYDVTVPAGETVTLAERSNNGIPPDWRTRADAWRVTVTYEVRGSG